ncbi:MAG: transposase [Gemmatimonadaceae bacterium]
MGWPISPEYSVESYERGNGRVPYHPVMMVKLLVYGYCIGRISSRKIETAACHSVKCRPTAGQCPG